MHLFVCANLTGTILSIIQYGKGKDDQSKQARRQVAYTILFENLRIAISAWVLHCLRFWSDTPGQCFVIPAVASHLDGMKIFIAWTA